MAKAAVLYACTECGYSSPRWFGKCPGCGSFGTLAEERPPDAKAEAAARPLLRLVDVQASDAERISTGVPELDRVLGGGLVPASVVLVGGEPGVGKSTLLLSALRAMGEERRVLLVTGEESPAQVRLRAERSADPSPTPEASLLAAPWFSVVATMGIVDTHRERLTTPRRVADRLRGSRWLTRHDQDDR